MLGREVEVPKDVDEVIGIEAGALRLLVYMHATDKIVGVEDFEKRDGNRPYIMAHPDLQEKPSIGPIHGGDSELIAEQQPDVIFWTYTTAGDADDLQEKTGIPVIGLNYGDLDDHRDTFFSAINLMGEVLKKESRAFELKDFFTDTIDDLNQRTQDIPNEEKPSCYIGGIGHRGAHGIKSTEPDYSPFEFVNADNVAGELNQDHAMVDPEKIIEWNPDILFIDKGGYELVKEDLSNNSKYSSIDAIQEDRVYGVLPYNYYTTNYGTVLANSYYIGKILYEARFDDIGIEEKVDEIYKKLLGEGVYQEMNETFGGYENLGDDINTNSNGNPLGYSHGLTVGLPVAIFIVSTIYFWKRKKR
ncbi:MAG: iron ABC transporter substrate-binding protein [Candidatus Thermoplasmatota archaeon]|nr:iron ABC transporter substrate-binding protein [Candidatus Thermoplasmatota archaeon]